MHRLCISCHREKAALLKKPDLSRCANCHQDIRYFIDNEDLAKQRQKPMGKTVILPPIEE
jgi:hypothetical protein